MERGSTRSISRLIVSLSCAMVLAGCGGTGASSPSGAVAGSPAPDGNQTSRSGTALTYRQIDKKTGAESSFVVARRGSDLRYAGPGFAVLKNGENRVTCQDGQCKKDVAPDGGDELIAQWFDPWGPKGAFTELVRDVHDVPGRTVAGLASACRAGTFAGDATLITTSCRAVAEGYLTFYEDSTMRQELLEVRGATDATFTKP